MPSGHAYAKALRVVKTCVGSEAPHGHAGQHANGQGHGARHVAHECTAQGEVCRERCLREPCRGQDDDAGIIGVRESGWEMYAASSNGGIKTEVAHFFTKLKTGKRKC